jgi:hypothetical protein
VGLAVNAQDSTVDTLMHIRRVQRLLNAAACELLRRGEMHDESKLGPEEKPFFDRATSIMKTLAYASDEYEAARAALGPALTHHYRVNSHHPEHYPDGVAGMDLFDVVEMLLDWKASSERNANGGFQESLEVSLVRFRIQPQLASILRNTAARHGLL